MYHINDRVIVRLPQPGGKHRDVHARIVRCRYIGELYHELGLSFTASAH